MTRKVIFTLIFIAVFVFLLWFGVQVLSPLPNDYYRDPASEDTTLLAQLDFDADTPTPLNSAPQSPELKQTGWIPYWDMVNGFASLKANAQYFDSVSPVWYHVDQTGSVTNQRSMLSEVRSFTRQNNIKLIPSIANFSADDVHIIFDDPEKLEAHIQYIKNEITTHDYDGFDIDYESIYVEDKPEFLYFMRSLYEFLEPQGKKLTVAVMSELSDADTMFNFRQTTEVLDWQELNNYAHEIRIMSYNLTNYTAKYPGPISPVDWKEAIIRYGLTKIDPEKLFIGVAQYGYDGWSGNPNIPEPYLSFITNPPASKGQADAVTYKDVIDLRAPYKTSTYLDKFSQEKVLKYEFAGKKYIVFYTDSSSHKFTVDLANEYQIGGLAHWRLGSEDPNVYSLISR